MNKYKVSVHVGGSKYWALDGEFHYGGRSAIEYPDGSKYWYDKGYLHREDGPAVELVYGLVTRQWYLNGRRLTEEEYTERRSVNKELHG